MPQLAHKLIKATCEEFAGANYEKFASNDSFYKKWPSQKDFIAAEWGRFIPAVRECLAKMLGRPCPKHMTDAQWAEAQEEIFEALMLDRSLPRSSLKMPKPQRRSW